MKSRNRTVKKRGNTSFPSRINLYSTPRIAQKMAYKYLGKTAKLYPAHNPQKKYAIIKNVIIQWISMTKINNANNAEILINKKNKKGEIWWLQKKDMIHVKDVVKNCHWKILLESIKKKLLDVLIVILNFVY